MSLDEIRREALALSVEDRELLAEQLLSSLDDLSEAEIQQLWLHEAARRAAELEQGQVQRISAEIVLREARSLLK
jgi:putative addiction module component (TIGR02574 family)